MTYLEIYQSAFAEVGSLYPHLRITAVQGLVWITEWVHELQNLTSAVKKITEWPLDPNSQDGHYQLPLCPKDWDKVEFFSPTPLVAGTSQDVKFYDYDTFERYRNGEQQTGYLYDTSRPFIFTVLDSDVWLYPFVGVSGRVRMHYTPELEAYSPGNTGDWAGWGIQPEGRMAVNTYPRAFRPAERSIKAYVKAMMIQAIPDWKNQYKNEYYENKAIADRGYEFVLKGNPPQGKDAPAIHGMGPVRR
jgi:hypothetical protein